MSLGPPTYLNSLQNNIRARPVRRVFNPAGFDLTLRQVAWDGAVRAGSLTDEQLKKIKAVDKVRKEQRKQTLEKDLVGYTTLLVGSQDGPSVFDKASKRTDILQYILVLAADLINGRFQERGIRAEAEYAQMRHR